VIEERERLQAAILGSIQEGVATIDREWRITSFSRRAEALTGHRAEDAIGRFCHEVLPSALCQQGCPALHCLETGDAEAEHETEILTAAGRPLSIVEKAIPLLDEQGEALGSVLVIEDRSAFGEGAADGAESSSFCGIVGRSEAMRRVFHVIEQVARTDVSVLLTGESGTGKEMAARAIHRRSARRAGPLEAINCAALPETLLESELFGHVRGAFTGAERDRSGRIAEAEKGSLFLDEVGEMPLPIQAKLLRFLQEREYQRLGESKTRSADVRIICATNRDLRAEVAAGRFREDLYYRIRVIPIELPPLRDRRGDIPLLAQTLLVDIAAKRDRPDLVWTPAALRALTDHAWPGNVRELVNAIEYAVALAPGRKLGPEDLPPEVQDSPRLPRPVAGPDLDDEKTRVLETLRQHGGNRSRAARALGIDRVTLYRKLKKWGA
jgi:PAS domain S-box-containing protein